VRTAALPGLGRAALRPFSLADTLDSGTVTTILGHLAKRTGDPQGEAARLAEALAAGGPGEPLSPSGEAPARQRLQTEVLMALHYLRLGRGPAAQAALTRALSAGPDFHPAIFLLGAAHASMGRHVEAAGAWRMVTTFDASELQAYLEGIDASVRAGRLEDAAELADEGFELWPGDPAVRERVAIVSALLGNPHDIERVTTDDPPTDLLRFLRLAALHDLALTEPAGSQAWQRFATAAAEYLAGAAGPYRASVEALLRAAPVR
jgi:tetratricopeptide (TPR) repeat protein